MGVTDKHWRWWLPDFNCTFRGLVKWPMAFLAVGFWKMGNSNYSVIKHTRTLFKWQNLHLNGNFKMKTCKSLIGTIFSIQLMPAVRSMLNHMSEVDVQRWAFVHTQRAGAEHLSKTEKEKGNLAIDMTHFIKLN